MTKEQYESLPEKDRLLYDEFSGFARRLTERLIEIVDILKAIVNAGND